MRDVAKMDREHSTSRQRERELKTSLGFDSELPSSTTLQSCSEKKEKVESRQYDDDSSDSRPSFTEAVKLPPAAGTDILNKVNLSFDEVFAQNPKSKTLK